MKCAICKKDTTWDESYGYEQFIVCPICHNIISHEIKLSRDLSADTITDLIIFKLGDRVRKENHNEI